MNMTTDELVFYYIKMGHWSAVCRLLDGMSPRELRMFEASTREMAREIALAQIRKGMSL